jgi:hypothetical protein
MKRTARNRALPLDHALVGLGDAKKSPRAARIAVTAVSTVPADSNTLPNGRSGDAGRNGIDNSYDFVPGYARVLDLRKEPLIRDAVAVADGAGLDLDPYRPGADPAWPGASLLQLELALPYHVFREERLRQLQPADIRIELQPPVTLCNLI